MAIYLQKNVRSFHRFLYYFALSVIIIISIFYLLLINKSQKVSLLEESRKCLLNKFQTGQQNSLDTEWLNLNNTVNKCTQTLRNSLELEQFPNNDEIKLGILPKSNKNAKCDVITLGIGKDVKAEKALLNKLNQCTFLGIDPDIKVSGHMYISELKGMYVQGLVGLSGSKNPVELERNNDVTKLYPNYSFSDFISRFFDQTIIDFLFMDIEGDEVELIKELIENPEKYPIICQINVEYHDTQKTDGYTFFNDMKESLEFGPFMPLVVDPFSNYNRIFFINFKNKECLDKYFSK